VSGSYPELKGKIALVTGGGRGLGKAICIALANEGVSVALTDLYHAEETAKEVEKLGQKTMPFNANVLKEVEVKKMIDRIVAEWGGIDILVNNVGGDHALLLEDLTEAQWDMIINLNLKGLFLCTKAVVPVMKKRGGGKIVNIASLAGLRMTLVGGITYTAAKAAVLGFTRQASFELGPFKINVNAVCPGATMTEVLESRLTPEAKERLVKTTPLRDLLRPEDQANAVVFLASDRARMITGTYLLVDGGASVPVGFVEWENFYAVRKQWLKEKRWEGKTTSL